MVFSSRKVRNHWLTKFKDARPRPPLRIEEKFFHSVKMQAETGVTLFFSLKHWFFHWMKQSLKNVEV
jgi:hypothetical protein